MEKRLPIWIDNEIERNEITERSLKGIWKNIWPNLSKSKDIGHSIDMDEIVETNWFR